MNFYNKVHKFPFKSTPYEIFLPSGKYKLEAWGAQGVDKLCPPAPGTGMGGKGAYTSGFLTLKESRKIYIFVGERGRLNKGSFNGVIADEYMSGGISGSGGATDFRLEKSENWYDFNSLKSRIMVAAGGDGSDCYGGGDGGGLNGYKPDDVIMAVVEWLVSAEELAVRHLFPDMKDVMLFWKELIVQKKLSIPDHQFIIRI